MESAPKDFICPITQEVMKNPVIGPDGITYEKKAIMDWLSKHEESPITRQPMNALQLVPNRALKATIDEMVNKKSHLGKIPLADNPQVIPLDLQLSAVKINDKKGHIQISITPPEEGPRQPCAFICCIDVSGSMNEEATLNNGVESDHLSRLDLVKHSVKTITHMMSDNEYLGLIVFNDSATTVMGFTRMTDIGRRYAQKVIDGLEAEGQTNIWDALRSAIDLVTTKSGFYCPNACILLFTDGEPNVNPPRGIMRSLNNLKKTVSLAFSIHTFGYGYQLDSELLLDIATTGFGSYNYIPDSSMLGTIFVNFVSNALATAARNVYLGYKADVQSISGLGFEIDSGKIQATNVEYGQKRDFILEFEPKPDGTFFFEAELFFGAVSTKKSISTYICTDQTAYNLALSRSLFCSVLIGALSQEIANKKGLEELSKIKPLLESLPTNNHEYVKELLKDITSTLESEGQVTKAFSKAEWFDKWGKHYIRSLIRAHQMQQCHNFKDRGVQSYGGKSFRDFQDKTEEIFGTLPAPKPSNKIIKKNKQLPNVAPVYHKPVDIDMYHYIDENAGCFDGEGLLTLSNGQLKRVKDLIKGDEIMNSDGRVARVVALVVTSTKYAVEVVNLNGVLITPWHPVRIEGEWKFPQSIKEPERIYCEKIYNLVLDKAHIATINGLDVITLGHGFKINKVVEHAYFGSQRIIEDLKKFEGWESGRVHIEKWNPIRDAETGLINGLL